MELQLPPLAETGATLTGAEIVIRCLEEEGVEFVFGYPGGAVLYIYDALARQTGSLKHILVRHEQGAVHAADGYARATGKPGVALVTSGPGVTNAVTGIATAYMDSIPMVVITGQVSDPRHRRGRIPGVRHGRHHAPVREAQLPREGREPARDHHQEGLPHRDHGASRAGAGGYPQGRLQHRGALPLPAEDPPALVQPGHQGARRADQESAATCWSTRSAR